MNQMKMFNVFGSLVVNHNQVTAMATTVRPDGSAIDKTSILHLDDPIEGIQEGDTALLIFAARVTDEGKPDISVQNMTKLGGGPDVFPHPAVQRVLRDVIRKFQKV